MTRGFTYLAALVLATSAGALAARAPQQGQSAAGRANAPDARGAADTDENGQPARLPSLPNGMTLDNIRAGDSLFHGKGGCATCHGQDATGMPNSGSSLTTGISFIPGEWRDIDSLITAGIPEAITRSSVAMPPRGAASNLSADETRQIAAYVWAISRVKGEPWPGGHRTHGQVAGDTTQAR